MWGSSNEPGQGQSRHILASLTGQQDGHRYETTTQGEGGNQLNTHAAQANYVRSGLLESHHRLVLSEMVLTASEIRFTYH